jgi:hypothetical protein
MFANLCDPWPRIPIQNKKWLIVQLFYLFDKARFPTVLDSRVRHATSHIQAEKKGQLCCYLPLSTMCNVILC